MKVIGIDDAGRGPVLGPMSLAGLMCEEEDEVVLKEQGAKDSKLLTKPKRKRLGIQFREEYAFHVENATAKEIDEFPNLNNLEAIKCGIIINTLMENVDEKVRVIVDCPSVNCEAWEKYLMTTILKKDQVEMVVEHKADLKWPSVSAASIIAKEDREEHVKKLKDKYGVDFGSGYPADPKTKEFLKDNWEKPEYHDLIRKSWATYKNLAKRKKQEELYFL
jgi:ribonuclease HII